MPFLDPIIETLKPNSTISNSIVIKENSVISAGKFIK